MCCVVGCGLLVVYEADELRCVVDTQRLWSLRMASRMRLGSTRWVVGGVGGGWCEV